MTLQFSKLKPLLFTVLASLVLAAVLSPAVAPAAVALDAEEAAFCRAVNDYRAANGLAPLMVSERLTNAAEWYSNDMAAKNYFNGDHTDSLGRGPYERIRAFGYTYATSWGENIAWGNATGGAAFTQWRNSPPHNANMLNGNFKVIGIGKASNPNSSYRHFWTTDFGGYVDPGAVPCPGSEATPSPTPTATSTPTASPAPTTSPSPTEPAPAVTPALSVADTSFPEGTSWFSVKVVQIPVSLSEPADDDVTVSYATSNGTATAGSDYGAVSGEVTIPEGSTGATVSIRVAMDRSREANETFNLTLSNPVNATVADGSAVVTIQNDD